MCLIIIAAIDLISFCTISILNLFVSEAAVSRGESINVFGVGVAYTNFLNLISSLFFGKIVPILGAKNVFLASVILSRICTISFGGLHYFEDDSHDLTAVVYILKGFETLGSRAYFIAGYAIVFTMFREDEVGVIRGLLETVAGIGTEIGPSIGKIFLLSRFHQGLPFYVVGVSVITIAIAGSYCIENVEDIDTKTKSLRNLFAVPNTSITCAVIFVVSLTTNCVEVPCGEFFSAEGIFFKSTAYVKFTIALAFAMSNPIWAYISDKSIDNPSWMMPSGLYFTGMSIAVLPFHKSFQNSMFDVLILCVVGVATAMALAPTFRCLTLGALDQGFKNTLTTHSSVCAIWSFTFSLGEILGPGLGRFLLTSYSFSTCCAFIAVINISTAVLCTLYLYNKVRNRNICFWFSFKLYFQ